MVNPQKLHTVAHNLHLSQLNVAGVKGYISKFRDILLTPVIKQLVDFIIQSKIFSNHPIKKYMELNLQNKSNKISQIIKGTKSVMICTGLLYLQMQKVV